MRFGFLVVLVSLFLMAHSVIIAAQTENVTGFSNVTASRTIEVNATLNKEKFLPGEKIKIVGTAEIIGGDNSILNGSVNIKIEETYSTLLKEGKFSFDAFLPNLTKSGDHVITIEVKDDMGDRGSISIQIYILPLPNRLDLYLNKNSFLPNDIINISAILRDQNNEPIDAATILTLYDSRGAEIVKAVVHDEKFVFNMPSDASPGDWWVYAFSDPMKTRRFFKVEEYSKIETFINGTLLVIKNIGNVPYQKSVSIDFLKDGSSFSKSVNLNLAVGAQTEVELLGSGSYKLNISSGESNNYFDGISLTGGAIGAKVSGDNSKLIGAVVIFVSALVALAIFFGGRNKGRYKNANA